MYWDRAPVILRTAMPDAPDVLDADQLGLYFVEGTVEVDPVTEEVTIRTVSRQGEPFSFNPVPALAQHKGVEVRLIIVPLESVAKIAKLAEARGVVVMSEPVTKPAPPTDPTAN